MSRCGRMIIVLMLVLCMPLSVFASEMDNLLSLESTYQMESGDYHTFSISKADGIWSHLLNGI